MTLMLPAGMLMVEGTLASELLLEVRVIGISCGARAGFPERSVSATTSPEVEWATATGGVSSTLRARGATPTTFIVVRPERNPVADAVTVDWPVTRDVLYAARAIIVPFEMVTVLWGNPRISAFEDESVTVVSLTAFAGM